MIYHIQLYDGMIYVLGNVVLLEQLAYSVMCVLYTCLAIQKL